MASRSSFRIMTDRAAGIVLAPVLVPLATALCVLTLGRHEAMQRRVSISGHVLGLAAAVALISRVIDRGDVGLALGGWSLPFAIEFRADRFGAAFVLLAAVTAMAVSVSEWGRRQDGSPPPYALNHGFIAGASGAFLTADLFNLYVWFEVVLVSSLGMLAWGGQARHLDAALRYFVLNVIGTVFLLVGIASVYALTGHLNLAAIGAAARAYDPATLAPLVAVLTTAFLIKAAAFPVFAWLPATYHTLPTPQAALFAAVGTKLGVYALLRLSVLLADAIPPVFGQALGWVAVATMLCGVLGAAYHWDIRRVLAFHSISQVGYMLLGIALGTVAGAQATLVFAVHHGLVKSNLFLIARLMRESTGSYDLREMGGLYTARPFLSCLFLCQALSLIGIPPSSGFWAKFLVIRETIRLGYFGWTVIALGVGMLTLYSMLKIWGEAFWKDHPSPDATTASGGPDRWTLAAASSVALLSVAFGLWPEPVLRFTATAARALVGGGVP